MVSMNLMCVESSIALQKIRSAKATKQHSQKKGKSGQWTALKVHVKLCFL